MHDLTWSTWHEALDMNWLRTGNWNEWLDLKWTERNELPKVLRSLQFFLAFFFSAELSLQSRAHFAAETETLQGRPRTATENRKRCRGFAPENAFRRDFTRSRSLTLPNYLMMRLTWMRWWCGWHDGETESSVTRKFPITSSDQVSMIWLYCYLKRSWLTVFKANLQSHVNTT